MKKSLLLVAMSTMLSFPLLSAPLAQGESSLLFNTGNHGCLNGDCSDGYGTFQFPNGDKYIGDFRQGRPNGRGILYFANGNKYLGDWQDNFRQGQGKFIFALGHEYEGQFKRNYFFGKGKMDYANGDRYDGDWQNNKPNGTGTYYFKTGNRYEGEFQEGRFNGKGTMFYKDATRFVGLWRDNRKHGKGTFYDRTGKANSGNWIDGRPLLNSLPAGEDGETIVVELPEDAPKERTNTIPAQPLGQTTNWMPKTPVRIFAVVVGIAKYAHMQALNFTDDDAYQVFAFLKSPQGGALPDNQIQILVDDNATHDNILNAMKNTFSQADSDDVVLFYFSGHGINGAFIPVDFDGFHNRLFHEEIRGVLDKCHAKHKIVFGDACHAGSMSGLGVQGDMLAAREPVRQMLEKYYKAFEKSTGGTALLLSSKEEEVSLEDSGLRSGVFSHFMIKGMKGEADRDRNGIITIDELYRYVSVNVTKYTAGAQTPILCGDYDRDTPVGVRP
ncbi:MAG: caspase family protein [Lewinellaceae bacterium]|nr:caspase family protein [Saprospiraceae bacterium]MCB9337988.1 caspase family protein [Lewinellaceae bacterium]